MTAEVKRIDYDQFRSQYWSPEQGRPHNVVLKIPGRMEEREYQGKTKLRMVFDVLMVDGEEYAIGKKEWVTGSSSFAEQFQPIEDKLIKDGKLVVRLRLLYRSDKRYEVTNTTPVNNYPAVNQ